MKKGKKEKKRKKERKEEIQAHHHRVRVLSLGGKNLFVSLLECRKCQVRY